MDLYNQVVEYYSAIGDENHVDFLNRLMDLLKNEEMQKALE